MRGAREGEGVLSFRGTPGGQVQGGCLCFEGTRIPVSVILGFLKAGDNDAAILDNYPSLTQLDLDAARWFDGKWEVRRRRGVQIVNCDGQTHTDGRFQVIGPCDQRACRLGGGS